MKISKMLKTISCTVGVMALSSVTALANEGFVSGQVVNVRQEANLGSTVLGKVNAGETFTVLDVFQDWFKISYNDTVGFISADYFEIETADAAINQEGTPLFFEPNTDSEVLFDLALNLPVLVTGKVGDWYQVNYSGKEGYISKEALNGHLLQDVPTLNHIEISIEDMVISEDTEGVVRARSGLNLRKEASTEAEVLDVLPNSTTFKIEEVGEQWVKAVTNNGKVGYLNKDFLQVIDDSKPIYNESTELGLQVIEYAKQFIGTPYAWGGTDLNVGVDCSGYVFSVMKNYGINLNRASYQMVENGVEVAKSELQAGDLVFFNTGGNSQISHVGMAMGNGQYIHASNGSAQSIVISDLYNSYSTSTYVTARRVLP